MERDGEVGSKVRDGEGWREMEVRNGDMEVVRRGMERDGGEGL